MASPALPLHELHLQGTKRQISSPVGGRSTKQKIPDDPNQLMMQHWHVSREIFTLAKQITNVELSDNHRRKDLREQIDAKAARAKEIYQDFVHVVAMRRG